MYKRLTRYLQSMEQLIAQPQQHTDWDVILARHLAQISFFQHERLVHLLVTLCFALMELVAVVAMVATASVGLAALSLLFLCLLVPYVVHYYHLENGTQRLYGQYDRLYELANDWHQRKGRL